MKVDVKTQIRDYFEYLDEQLDERPVGRTTTRFDSDSDVLMARPPLAATARSGVWFSAAAIVMIVALFVAARWLIPADVDPADNVVSTTLPSSPTTVLENQAPVPSIGRAEIVEGYEPFGKAIVEYSSSETPQANGAVFLPYGDAFDSDWATPHGGIVTVEDGYLALGSSETGPAGERVSVILSSTGASDWVRVESNLSLDSGTRGRLFEAGGRYWIETLVPTRLYRSSDGVTWTQIALPIPSDWSATPIGFPFVDQRFVEFDGNVVGFGDDLVIAVDTASGEVTSRTHPWSLPENGFWFSTAVIGPELHVFVSSYPDTGYPDTIDNPVLEEWTTTDLIDWSGPGRPDLAYDDTQALSVAGSPERGYVGAILYRGRFAGFFSKDGRTWQRFDLPGNGYGPLTPIVPTKLGGRQALVSIMGEASSTTQILVSDDGIHWQAINIDEDLYLTAYRFGVSLSVVDDSLLFYRETEDTLHSWRITFE